MNQDLHVRSARIYEFPLGRVRAAAPNAKPISQPRPASAVPSQTARTDFGSGWYHEAAIEEEARRKAKS
jgi:Protein of unknown function (DUF2735)